MSAVAEDKKIVVGGSFLIEERTPEEIFTPEDFTEEHRMIADTARQFMDNEVRPRVAELEKKDWKLARELVQKGAELGFVGATVAEEYGGLGLDQMSGAASSARRWGARPLSPRRWARRAASGCCPSSTTAPRRRSRSTSRASSRAS